MAESHGLAFLLKILCKDRVAMDHSCSQFQTLDAVKGVIGPVMCCQGKGSEALECDCKVKQIFLLLLPSISTESEVSELLFALVQLLICVRFHLARQPWNLVPSIFEIHSGIHFALFLLGSPGAVLEETECQRRLS